MLRYKKKNRLNRKPAVVNSNKIVKMADTETNSIDTHDTSNDAGEDPLQDLTDEQLYQLVEDTLYVYGYFC